MTFSTSVDAVLRFLKDLGVQEPKAEEEIDLVAVARSRLSHGVPRSILRARMEELLGVQNNEDAGNIIAAVFQTVNAGGGLKTEEVFEVKRDPLASMSHDGYHVPEFKRRPEDEEK